MNILSGLLAFFGLCDQIGEKLGHASLGLFGVVALCGSKRNGKGINLFVPLQSPPLGGTFFRLFHSVIIRMKRLMRKFILATDVLYV